MSEAIASRELLMEPTRTRARLEILGPICEADGTWICSFNATGFSRSAPPAVFGNDSLQALKIATTMAEIWLGSLPEYKNRLLLHLDGTVYSH